MTRRHSQSHARAVPTGRSLSVQQPPECPPGSPEIWAHPGLPAADPDRHGAARPGPLHVRGHVGPRKADVFPEAPAGGGGRVHLSPRGVLPAFISQDHTSETFASVWPRGSVNTE